MMRVVSIAALAASTMAVPAYAAVTVSMGGINDPNATFNFDQPDTRYDGPTFNDTVANDRIQPGGSTGRYAAVGPGNGVLFSTLDLSGFGAIDSITLLWGTVDSYNTLTALGTSFSIGGGELGVPQGSDQVVTLTFTGADRFGVTGLRFDSTPEDAFEFDNVNIASVPEPATWSLMIGGIGAVGGTLRRRRNKVQMSVSFA